jgi:hypothetical protein
MAMPQLLAELVAMGCTSAVLDSWYRFVPALQPDGRMSWVEARPGEPDVQVHACRVILRPLDPLLPVLVQHAPPPTFLESLLRSQVVVREATPTDCHPHVGAVVARLFRHPERGLSVVK